MPELMPVAEHAGTEGTRHKEEHKTNIRGYPWCGGRRLRLAAKPANLSESMRCNGPTSPVHLWLQNPAYSVYSGRVLGRSG